jgi:hypothetical protein
MHVTPCHTSISRVSHADTANCVKRSQKHPNCPIGSSIWNWLNHPKCFTFYVYRTKLPPCSASVFCDLSVKDLLEMQDVINTDVSYHIPMKLEHMLPQAMHPMSSSFLPMTHIIGDHLQAGKATLEKVDIRNQCTHLNIETC